MTITLANREYESWGDRAVMVCTAYLGTYAAGGVALTAATLGFHEVDLILCERKTGVMYSYDHTNATMMAYRQKKATATGSLSKPAVTTTDGSVAITSGTINQTLYFDPDSTSAKMCASSATGVTPAVFGITPVTMALATEVEYTGAAIGTAAFEEVSDGASLTGSGNTFKMIVFGS